ncbi:aspirochlorine biosynthesis cytochrome P450 monooxygenase [Microdochium nivale]|nr:aspirochlorine biosynthesis cytochrome P450 monooxygenase [Microdochium nivale]
MKELMSHGSVHISVLLLAGLAASLIVFMIGTVVYRIWLHPLSKIPGPKHLATFDIFNLYTSCVSLKMSEYAIELHRKYGRMVRIGPNRVIVDGTIAWSQVHGVRSTSEANEFGKFPGFIVANDNFGIIGARREDHRRQRRHMGYAFSARSI